MIFPGGKEILTNEEEGRIKEEKSKLKNTVKEKFTEDDFKSLGLEAEELMQQLQVEYNHVLDNLNTVDRKILQERSHNKILYEYLHIMTYVFVLQ